MKLQEYIDLECDFLHGIATPLMVAAGQIEYLLEKQNINDLTDRLKRAEVALAKVVEELNDRREFVKSVIDSTSEKTSAKKSK